MHQRIVRRDAFRIVGSAALLASCQSAKGPDLARSLDSETTAAKPRQKAGKASGNSYEMGPPPDTADLSRIAFTPQFLDGKPGSRELWEIGFSLHCGHTRTFFREEGKRLAAAVKAGETALFMSHLIRTENELPVGVELMRAGPRRYGEAVYATLGLVLHLDRAVTAKEVRKFLDEAGFRKYDGFSRTEAEVSLLGLRRLYEDGLGVTETPFIKKSGIG